MWLQHDSFLHSMLCKVPCRIRECSTTALAVAVMDALYTTVFIKPGNQIIGKIVAFPCSALFQSCVPHLLPSTCTP